MEFQIYRKNTPSQFINLSLQLNCAKGEVIQLQLPSWRPGRYELANYAQNLRHFQVAGPQNHKVPFEKITKDLWCFTATDEGLYRIDYEYYAAKMDAGGSWSDDEQLYLNFINFTFLVKGREDEKIKVSLNIPKDYRVATALPATTPFTYEATGFQHLVDSPLIASASLTHTGYKIRDVNFHIWCQGSVAFDLDELKTQFIRFTEKQIDAFGDFPAADYHFLIQLLPYMHYHGVEHRFSTVITLGPAKNLANRKGMDQLIGVSSHELYHFWNVCRIRPKVLAPYDFSKEAYTNTGVVLEGVTSYMGDLFLLKSGYYSITDFLIKLEKLINREFQQFGWQSQSITESSFDLWLDGYKPGIPNKKVNIYNRGALISLCLDLILLDHHSSLQEVMKRMWLEFGKKEIGYTLEDYEALIANALTNPEYVKRFFQDFIYGKKDLLPLLKEQLASTGIEIVEDRKDEIESDFGVILNAENLVQSIHPESDAYKHLMLGDHIVKSDYDHTEEAPTVTMTVVRNERQLEFTLTGKASAFYKHYRLIQLKNTEKTASWIS